MFKNQQEMSLIVSRRQISYVVYYISTRSFDLFLNLVTFVIHTKRKIPISMFPTEYRLAISISRILIDCAYRAPAKYHRIDPLIAEGR